MCHYNTHDINIIPPQYPHMVPSLLSRTLVIYTLYRGPPPPPKLQRCVCVCLCCRLVSSFRSEVDASWNVPNPKMQTTKLYYPPERWWRIMTASLLLINASYHDRRMTIIVLARIVMQPIQARLIDVSSSLYIQSITKYTIIWCRLRSFLMFSIRPRFSVQMALIMEWSYWGRRL